MNAVHGSLSFVLCLLSCALLASPKPVGMADEEAAKWTLSFSDDFDGAALDRSKWSDFNPHFAGRPGSFVFARSNVAVKDGSLELTARELTDAEKASDLRGFTTEKWATGTVKSRARIRYGYFEARIRSMKANVCNAFWLYDPLSDNLAKKHAAGDESEEIDIVEMFGKPRDEGLARTYCATLHRYLTPYTEAIVNRAKAEVPGGSFRQKMPFDFWADYHVYGCKWTESEIVWYVDGEKVFSRANDHWKRPLHVMLDCEVIASWAGEPDAADLPSTMSVDYVRVWTAPDETKTIEEEWAKSGTRREYLEWVNVWREQAHAARWSKLPKVLVIGDSIVGNYFDTVSKELKGIADCTRLNGSRVVGDPVLLQQFQLVNDEKYAVIHVNNGLHGYDTTEPDYARYLAEYIDYIRAHQPQAKIIWGRSTQMMPAFCEYEKRNERLLERNRLADAIMAARGIPMTDLFSVTYGKPELYSPDGIHYNEAGSRALGLAAAASIKKALGL